MLKQPYSRGLRWLSGSPPSQQTDVYRVSNVCLGFKNCLGFLNINCLLQLTSSILSGYSNKRQHFAFFYETLTYRRYRIVSIRGAFQSPCSFALTTCGYHSAWRLLCVTYRTRTCRVRNQQAVWYFFFQKVFLVWTIWVHNIRKQYRYQGHYLTCFKFIWCRFLVFLKCTYYALIFRLPNTRYRRLNVFVIIKVDIPVQTKPFQENSQYSDVSKVSKYSRAMRWNQ